MNTDAQPQRLTPGPVEFNDRKAVLRVENLIKHYRIERGFFRRTTTTIRAVSDVSLTIRRGETLALVGESGCGKTTVARCIIRAHKPTGGSISFSATDDDAIDIGNLSLKDLKPIRQRMQMIFQDPFSSLNPRMTVGEIIAEPLIASGVPATEQRARVKELLQLVGMPTSAATRFPHAFSGGQRQRIGIARALAPSPALLVADEPVSALDVSVQAQIINLLLDIQDRLQLSMLFISHDLSVVRHVSDRIAVMYLGRIVEEASTETLYSRPLHPYTEALLSAVPSKDPTQRGRQLPLTGDIADPSNIPTGCAFHPRCRYATEPCRKDVPALRRAADGTAVACHRARELHLTGVGSNDRTSSYGAPLPTN